MVDRKRRLGAIGVLVALAMLVAACGNGEDGGTTDTSDASDTTSSDTTSSDTTDTTSRDTTDTTSSDTTDTTSGEEEGADFREEVAILPDVDTNQEEGDPCPADPDNGIIYPVVSTANEFLYRGDQDPVELERAGLEFEPLWETDGVVYYLVQGSFRELDDNIAESAFRQHYFAFSPIHRGHPVDDPDKTLAGGTYEPAAAGSGSVAVIDAEVDPGNIMTEHGPFILSLLDETGAQGSLYPIAVVKGATDSLFFKEADIIRAIGEIAAVGHDVVNLSMGTYGCEGYSPGGIESALELLGIEVVASAGNDGSSQPTYPAASFIGVGSTAADGKRSCFSNFGPWVDYWVPGEEVLGMVQGDDATWSGTSFAAPQVAAEVAGGISASASMPTDLAPDGGYGC
ncbi:MAG: S8 family serine peptidase [Acidimicrobiales bacterium]